MDGRCANCGTWLMPGHATCASCHAPIAGAPPVEDDPLDPFDPMDGAELPALDPQVVAPTPAAKPEPKPSPAVIAARLRQEAGYGLPPDSLLASVPYAASVWSRRRGLRVRLAEVKARERVLVRALDKRRRGLAKALLEEPGVESVAALARLIPAARAVHERETQQADAQRA
ncbi:MAG: hypothetical protein GXP55_07885, partial [Deltaproteobacteria bacterium]|nr:hypothetical protein [Deltaproteobacteria bacterium]